MRFGYLFLLGSAPALLSAAPALDALRAPVNLGNAPLSPNSQCSNSCVDADDLASDKILGEMITDSKLNTDFPGLRNSFVKLRSGLIGHEDYTRNALNSIKLHPEYKAAFAELNPDLQADLKSYMAGIDAKGVIGKRDFIVPASPAAKRHFKRMMESGTTESSRRWLNARRDVSPTIYEDASNTKLAAVRKHPRSSLRLWC